MKKVFVKGSSFILLALFFVNCSNINAKDTTSSIQLSDIEDKDIASQIAPKAVANDNIGMLKSVTNKLIQFDAKNSYDPDGNNKNLSYRWTNANSQIMSYEKSFVHKYDKKGLYEITLMVTDVQNLTAIDRICVLVDIDKSDMPLIAKAGEDQEVNANEKVNLTSRVVCRDDVLKYEWRDGEKLLSTKANFTTTFKAGKYTLVLTVVDDNGNKATDIVVINVI